MTERNVIVAGWYTVQPAKRDAVIESFKDMAQRARSAPGCLDFSIAPDPIEPGRVNMFEFWESEKALKAWRASAKGPKRIAKMLQVKVCKHVIHSSGRPF
jgi:quinol monooxygenase YgiN